MTRSQLLKEAPGKNAVKDTDILEGDQLILHDDEKRRIRVVVRCAHCHSGAGTLGVLVLDPDEGLISIPISLQCKVVPITNRDNVLKSLQADYNKFIASYFCKHNSIKYNFLYNEAIRHINMPFTERARRRLALSDLRLMGAPS